MIYARTIGQRKAGVVLTDLSNNLSNTTRKEAFRQPGAGAAEKPRRV
jgi:hypothetical protein